MITIKKAEDISVKKFKHKVEAFSLFEDERLVMTCLYILRKDKLEIYDISGETGDFVLVDALVRAVSSYAQGKDINIAVCANRELDFLLTPLGFEENDRGTLWALTEKLLRHKCCGEA